MRRERIIKAVNSLREALHAAQIRELLRVARTGQQADSVNRTQRILLAYNEFTRHYQQFGEEEKDLMTFFGLTPLLDLGFWSGLIDGEQAVNRKLISDVDVGAYNVIFVMPKLRELLTRETDKGELIITDSQGTERDVKRVRVLIAEKERSLTDPQIIINVIRSMDELYSSLSALHIDAGVNLSIGSINSGSAKSLDFFGASPIMEDINSLLINVWDRIKYAAEDNFRYQIEIAMMAAGFVRADQGRAVPADDRGGAGPADDAHCGQVDRDAVPLGGLHRGYGCAARHSGEPGADAQNTADRVQARGTRGRSEARGIAARA